MRFNLNKVISIMAALFCCHFAAVEALSQTSESPNQVVRKSSEELMKSATLRIKPTLPPIAKAIKAGGVVVIAVQVDEKGKVTSARVVSGHPLLRQAALTAAWEWTFTPEASSRGPVKVEGEIPFNFDLDSILPESAKKGEDLNQVHPSLTSQQQESLQQAQSTADRFIERWHQSLDIGPLFEEMYVTNGRQREVNIYLFYVLYRCLAGLGFTPGWEQDVDSALQKKAFVAMLNFHYLTLEFTLAFTRPEDERFAALPEITTLGNIFKAIKLDDEDKGKLTRRQIEEFVEKANLISSAYRRRLTQAVFSTPYYRANLVGLLGEPSAPQIVYGSPNYGVDKNIELYLITRGPFQFYFIKENGTLKVLTLGFEC